MKNVLRRMAESRIKKSWKIIEKYKNIFYKDKNDLNIKMTYFKSNK